MQGCQTLLGDSFEPGKFLLAYGLALNVAKYFIFRYRCTCKDAGLPNVARRLTFGLFGKGMPGIRSLFTNKQLIEAGTRTIEAHICGQSYKRCSI